MLAGSYHRLKPCRCGGEPTLVLVPAHYTGGNPLVHVVCRRCGNSTPDFVSTRVNSGSTDAVVTWNQRFVRAEFYG